MRTNLSTFSEHVKQYERARRLYQPEVFQYLKKILPAKNPLILDLGCGTGISTRQLTSVGRVIGCDPDPLMLQAAKRHTTSHRITYVVGKADKLPFQNSKFDVVTAFAAFHWFNDAKSIAEIRRVLKLGGIFFIVNKTGLRSWGEGYRKAIIKSIGQEIAQFRENTYLPKKDLKENDFRKVAVKSWKNAELFTLPNALEYVQSVSIWNSVPRHLRIQALAGVRKHFQRLLKNVGKIERKLTTRVVVGEK